MVEKKKVNWTFVVLVALLVITIGYIAVSEFGNWRDTRDAEVYQQGAQDAITQISQTAAQCQEVPLQTEKEKVTLVSVECLQQEQGEQQLPAEEETIENDSGSEELLGGT